MSATFPSSLEACKNCIACSIERHKLYPHAPLSKHTYTKMGMNESNCIITLLFLNIHIEHRTTYKHKLNPWLGSKLQGTSTLKQNMCGKIGGVQWSSQGMSLFKEPSHMDGKILGSKLQQRVQQAGFIATAYVMFIGFLKLKR